MSPAATLLTDGATAHSARETRTSVAPAGFGSTTPATASSASDASPSADSGPSTMNSVLMPSR